MTLRKAWIPVGWLPRIQFSLANLLAFVTVVGVSLAVGRIHAHAGALLALLLCGCWLTGALARMQWYRATYFMAAFTAGLFWYAAMSLPITPIGPEFASVFPSFPLAICFCLASLAGAAVVRLLGLHDPGETSFAGACLLAVFTWMIFYLLIALIAFAIGRRSASEIDISPVGAIVFFIFHSYLILPCGWLIALMLRDAELLAYAAIRDERAVYDAVEELERRGQLLILPEDVARQAKLEPTLTNELLLVLRSKEYLDYNADQGYLCRRRR